MHVRIHCIVILDLNDISCILDLDQPNAANLLNEELGGVRQPQTDDAWFPYESKTVSLPANTLTTA